MGLETALIAATVVSVGSSIAGGISANNAAKREAALEEEQGRIAQDEANVEAGRRADEVRKFRARQKMGFLKSGVTLEGSPLLVLEETLNEGQKEVDAIVRSGDAKRRFANESASITRSKGRAAMISGFGNAASSAISSYGIGKQAGMFQGKKPATSNKVN